MIKLHLLIDMLFLYCLKLIKKFKLRQKQELLKHYQATSNFWNYQHRKLLILQQDGKMIGDFYEDISLCANFLCLISYQYRKLLDHHILQNCLCNSLYYHQIKQLPPHFLKKFMIWFDLYLKARLLLFFLQQKANDQLHFQPKKNRLNPKDLKQIKVILKFDWFFQCNLN